MVALLLRGARAPRDPTVPRAVDVPGVLLAASGLTALTLVLIQGAAWGWGSPAILGRLGGGAALFASFAVVERRSDHPSIDFTFFRRRAAAEPIPPVLAPPAPRPAPHRARAG